VRTLTVVLIGGTSHVGKSTLARALATSLGFRHESTARLARHPGRPWTATRPDVQEHYARLSVDELTVQQLEHYERMWPLVERQVRDELGPGGEGLVLDGSGVLPQRVALLPPDRVAAVWLTAAPTVLRDRIHAGSRIEERSDDERRAAQKFLGRTELYQTWLLADLERAGLPHLDVSDGPGVDDLVARVRRLIGAPAARS
jgi:ABC-type cobalamin/Fe3+-siderophores transport system ATPase subunit